MLAINFAGLWLAEIQICGAAWHLPAGSITSLYLWILKW